MDDHDILTNFNQGELCTHQSSDNAGNRPDRNNQFPQDAHLLNLGLLDPNPSNRRCIRTHPDLPEDHRPPIVNG